jgi:hypothetical protein
MIMCFFAYRGPEMTEKFQRFVEIKKGCWYQYALNLLHDEPGVLIELTYFTRGGWQHYGTSDRTRVISLND